MILACDAGGTKTNLALLEIDGGGGGLRVVTLETYASRDHASLHEIVSAFVGSHPARIEAAGFGIAGPVFMDHAATTNLPWTVDGARLARVLGLPGVSLLNDVEAQAWSVLRLRPADWLTLQTGTPVQGNIAVISPGTGLGFAALVRGDGGMCSLASEGGHADFAPGDDQEIALLRFLRRRFGHVSVERVLSGPGLSTIYEFLRDGEPGEEPRWLAEALEVGDRAATVAEAALAGRSRLAERAVLLFLGVCGAEAGNWALRTMATGGVWLGGGVARKLLVGPPGTRDAWRQQARDAFLAKLRNKGRLSALLEAIPVQLIMTDEAPLVGAAHVALSQADHQHRT